MIKYGSVNPGDITTLNVYAASNSFKTKQKLIKLWGETVKSTIKIGDFDTPVSVIDKRSLWGTPVDQWDRIENPEIKPTPIWKFFAKDENAVEWSKDSSFNNWCWNNLIATCAKTMLDPCLMSYTKVNSK